MIGVDHVNLFGSRIELQYVLVLCGGHRLTLRHAGRTHCGYFTDLIQGICVTAELHADSSGTKCIDWR